MMAELLPKEKRHGPSTGPHSSFSWFSKNELVNESLLNPRTRQEIANPGESALSSGHSATGCELFPVSCIQV